MNGRQPWREGHAEASSSHPPKRRRIAHDDPEDGLHDSRNRSPASNDQYTIAWICALPIEMTAARAMLDDIYEDLPRHTNDTNTYTLGGIQGHNIVIACLPIGQCGTNNAASVLTHLIRTFPSIRLGLMVGIGGGVPGKVDMRLGDVVVGTRVVQYDLGKTIGNGQNQRTAIPKSPHHLLGTAVSSLQARHERDSSRIPLILEAKFDEHPQYRRPTTVDRLFLSTYEHTSPSPSCDKCDRSKLVPRSRRSTDNPVIHYGTIASGNQVMRNGTQRDNIARQLDAICFEMEAAGLMDILPCLPIRGICDYSDSHKNKEWQRYAAAAAAAYTRELVAVLPVADVPSPCKLNSVHDGGDKQCLKDLRVTDPRDDRTRIRDTKGRLLRNCYHWILDNDDFLQWRDDPQCQLLWIKGDPGKGKTMLLCGIIEELEKEPDNRLSYFFCQATEARLSNATAVLRGLIYLLVVQQPSLISHIREKHDHAGKQLFEDGNAWEALSKILAAMLNDPSLEGAILIVDALDECKTNRHQLLDLIAEPSRVKWIVSSRNWPDIEEKLDNAKQKVRLHLELNKDSISKPVDTYIGYKVDRLACHKKYDKETRDAVENHLTSNADGTFLWVALVCQELADPKVRKRHTLNTLKSFPPGLDSLYDRMIGHIGDSKDAGLCKEVLAIASVVYRPVTLDELQVLVESLEDFDQDDLEEIIRSCGSFLTLREGVIYFVHQSAKDFLLNKASDQILPSGAAHQHHAIFSRSLEALSETLERDVYELSVPGFPIDQVSPPVPDPLASIRYSCVFWVDHLDDSESRAKMSGKDLQDAGIIHDFLRNKYLYWLESLSLLRTMSDGVMAVQKLEALIKTKEVRQLMELLRDARRFILSHKRAIEIAPLQVYASALVFSPTRSLIRELFEKEEPNWITLKPSVESDWNACVQTLEGHGGWVSSVAFSADGQRLASGSGDDMIKVWDTATGACVQTLEGHGDWVRSVAFSADGQRLASGSDDITVKVWDAATGACVQTLEGHDGLVFSVAFSADSQRLASGSDDDTVKVWDAATGACVQTLEGHGGWVRSVAFSADSQRLASGSEDTTVKVWDAATGACVQTLKGHGSWVNSVAFSADSQRLASGSDDDTVKVWDAATGACVQTLEGHSSFVSSVAFSADGQRLASGSGDDTVKVWDAATGAYVQTLEGHSNFVRSVAFSADGQQLASGSEDTMVKVWDAATGACVQTLEGHGGWVRSVAFSADGQQLASGSHDKTVKVWDAATGACVQTLEGHDDLVFSVAFSTNNQQLASSSRDDTVKVWDAATGACVQTLEGHDNSVNSVAFSADSQRLASGSDDMTIKVWDAATGACVQTLEGHSSFVSSVAFSADSQRLASGSYDKTVKVWDAATGAYVQTLEGHSSFVSSVAFSADGQRLASGSGDDTVKVWDAATGACAQTLEIGRLIIHLSFDPMTNSLLSTDIGLLNLDLPGLPPAIDSQSTEAVSRGTSHSGYGISTDGVWIVKDEKGMLWLPAEYRASASVVLGSTVALGCRSGRVLVMKFC